MNTTDTTENQPSKEAMEFAANQIQISDHDYYDMVDFMVLGVAVTTVHDSDHTMIAGFESDRALWTCKLAAALDTFAAPHIAEAIARRREAAAAELDAATLRGENAQLRRQLEAAEKMAKSIRMTKGEVDYDPCYEDGLGNTYTAYAMDTDYYHNMMGALRGWDEAATPPLAAPIPDSIIETYEEGQG